MIREHPTGCTIAVRAQPGARRTAIAGAFGEGDSAALKIAIQAAPIEGRANEALTVFLASLFSLPKSSVTLLAGELSRSKVFLLKGVSRTRAQAMLARLQ